MGIWDCHSCWGGCSVGFADTSCPYVAPLQGTASIQLSYEGTLWDAVPEITLCWNQAIAGAGVDRPPLTQEEVRACMGMQIADIAARRLPGLTWERQQEVIAECCRVENDYLAAHGAAVYPGAEETLRELAGMCKLFVVSNCQDGYIQAFFAGTGLGKYFTDFECAGRTDRPKAENIALVVEKYGLKNPVYVGDTALDGKSAAAAGVPFIHANYGFGAVEGARQLERLSDLPRLVRELSK